MRIVSLIAIIVLAYGVKDPISHIKIKQSNNLKMDTTEKIKLIEFLEAMPNRDCQRPLTIGPAPHTQTNQFPNTDDYADVLHQYIMTFDGVTNGTSHIGDGGLRAYFIEKNNSNGFTEKFLVDNEFAHIHRHGSKSLHIVLPPDLGAAMDKKGWTENHPLAVAGRIPETNYMLFGARSKQELELSKALLRISFLFSTNQW